jgi:hypothetical protein
MPDGPAPYPTGEVVLPSLPEIQREREGVGYLKLPILYHTFQKRIVPYFRLRTQTKLTVDAA